ncbi:hypothetical protein FSW04_25410 [Baekduia soli]|uniref:Uncharacterized protein n=1 Tax=Baekduia soli TaxID=496014 RepID=A0A5B8UD51_9ACTN|nr:hypothetical protein [Baekduia soli]QEC50592.1 hypothetical protein FSW04_25410 [Baekduia soli]
MVPAVSSSLLGVSAAQDQLDVATRSVARSGPAGADDGTAGLVGGVVGAQVASVRQEVSLTMLRRAMDAEKSIIDILA